MKIAFLGTGLMGAPMAHRILAAGHELHVYNRTIAKTATLVDAGAKKHESPAAAIAAAELVVVMVADGPAVEQILCGEESRAVLLDKTIIQMSTIAPAESATIGARIQAAGGRYLEAPVLGSIPQATDGSLFVLAGGGPDDYEELLPILQIFGPTPKLIGPVGSAAAFKLALNQMIATLTTAVSLSLNYLQRKDIDIETFMEILRASPLYAPTFDKKLAAMLGGDFSNPNFPLRLLLKDVDLMRHELEMTGLDPAVLDGVAGIIARSTQRGHADDDYSSLFAGIPEE